MRSDKMSALRYHPGGSARGLLLRILILLWILFSSGTASGSAFPTTQRARPLAAYSSLGLSPSEEPWLMPDPQVQALIDRVTPTLVYSYVASLSGEQAVMIGNQLYTIFERNTFGGAGIQLATRFAHERFARTGLSTRDQVWYDVTNPNIIAEQVGVWQPERIFLITAHLDNKPDVSPGAPLAPGADDNASGSTGVLIAAEILSQFPCHHTLRYALFTGEEQGLLGSRAYVASVIGEQIEGVLNLDMIGWEADGYPEIDLYARRGYPADARIAQLFVQVVTEYSLDLTPEVLDTMITGSDHYSFWERGFPAILAIEDKDDFNVYYHTPEDRLEHLDLDYLTNFIKASVGALAHIACLASAEIYLPVMRKNIQFSR